MARARFIRPEFFTDEKNDGVPIAAQLLLLGLWCHADLRGVFDIGVLRGALLDLGPYFGHLIRSGHVVPFKVSGKGWGYVAGWPGAQIIGQQEIQAGSGRPPPPGWIDPPYWAAIIAAGALRGSQVEWRQIRARVFERDAFACVYCGSTAQPLHCDHVTPVSKGGETSMDNLATACAACNLSKGAKPLSEWRG